MKQKLSQFIQNAIHLPAGVRFKANGDGSILFQEDKEDDTEFFVYLEAENDVSLYDGLAFSRYSNPVEILKKIEKIAYELKGRI